VHCLSYYCATSSQPVYTVYLHLTAIRWNAAEGLLSGGSTVQLKHPCKIWRLLPCYHSLNRGTQSPRSESKRKRKKKRQPYRANPRLPSAKVGSFNSQVSYVSSIQNNIFINSYIISLATVQSPQIYKLTTIKYIHYYQWRLLKSYGV
jgi:hypothetical protein